MEIVLLIVNTAVFTLLGIYSAYRTGDTKWPFAFGFFSLLPATMILGVFGAGSEWRRIVITLLVAIYTARMLYTLLFWFAATGASKIKGQSPRSQLLFLPLLLVPIFSWIYPLPFFAAMDRHDGVGVFDAAALAFYIIGTVFHLGSDYQKWQFRNDRDNHGKLLRKGFWRLSRHPNYFGDFLIYCSFAIISVWPWGLLSPLVNLLQYLVDAIPKNESRSLKRYGKIWEEYARDTPILIPWSRRKQ